MADALLLERAPLGLSLPTRGGLTGSDMTKLAQAAEDADFDAVFVAERVADSLVMCQQMLSGTSTLTVGTAVLNARLRHPVQMAMTAMALADASGGRFVLGLGTANDRLNESMLGLGHVAPLPWMDEYLAVIRQTCGGGPVQFPGRYFEISDLVVDRPSMLPLRVYLGALQAGMLRLAGRVADGVILNLCSLAALTRSLSELESVAQQREEDLDAPHILCVIQCCVSHDVELAKHAARLALLDYILHPAAAQIFADGAEAGLIEKLQEAVFSGNRDRAVALVPDEFVDQFVVFGTPDQCAKRVRRYREAGVHMPVLFPRPIEDDWASAVWELAESYRGLESVPAKGSRTQGTT
ncbi:MAG TPA: LLM class flavin-dependent oxidoreductase [Acidimicrobiales bacterium]|jgi:alkanesulfonate monooxygenase SsuD/methylene tetrahydromethanopterin reductase-like flavin-dependent oxidoreductase (luciferase family)